MNVRTPPTYRRESRRPARGHRRCSLDPMLTRRSLRQGLLVAIVAVTEACGGMSSSAEAPTDGGPDGPASDAQTSEAASDGETPDVASDDAAPDVDNDDSEQCDAIEVLPPSFTVLTSPSAGCDPTFTV